jgi:hypothetical protein
VNRVDLAADPLDLVGIAEAVDEHVGAFCGERPGNGETDPARRSRHDGAFGVQVHDFLR